MIAVGTLLIVLALSLLIVRIASVALSITGMSTEAANFQARSAFTGTGFTTSESEMIVNHPVRRRIVTLLMVVRNAGFITAVSSLILSFTGLHNPHEAFRRLLIIFSGVSILLLLSYSKYVNKALNRFIERLLKKWTKLNIKDYLKLLHLSENYQVIELKVNAKDWLAERKLQDLRLIDEGVIVLGVERENKDYIGAPTGKCKILPGDTVILYGMEETLADLDKRTKTPSGNKAHQKAKKRHAQEIKIQAPKEK